MTTVAALFVATGGAYFDLDGVDPWDITRDARLYAGPHPVIAHPPCERWGRYWSGGPSAKVRRIKGDDGGCFRAALSAARRFSGVLEHPEASHAFEHFGIAKPARAGGWSSRVDNYGGRVCCVEQGHYGHRARKATWLYAVGLPILPELMWGSSGPRARLDRGFHSKAERAAAGPRTEPATRLTTAENLRTPDAFRDLLLSLARSTRAVQERAA